MDNPGPTTTSHGHLHRRRYLDRITAFSDGVVAIALTLLVLPLVDIVPPDVAAGQSTWQALSDNSALLWSFAVTFLVIAVMWMAHSRVFMLIEEYDEFIVWVNVAYLFAIVILPFPSKWLQVEGFDGGVGTFYFLALMVASGSLYLISRHVRRNPQLQTEEARADPTLGAGADGLFFAGYFLVGAVVSTLSGELAGWYLLALWPVSIIWRRVSTRRHPPAPS